MNEPLIDTSQGPDAGLLNALAEAEADRDRARNIAVALEQQLAAIQGEVTAGQHDARDDWMRCTCWKRNVQAILDGATLDEARNG